MLNLKESDVFTVVEEYEKSKPEKPEEPPETDKLFYMTGF